jgi:thioredoxin reductase
MKTRQIGYAVIGESLAGLAAALTLAEAQEDVVLLDFDRDTDSLIELPRVRATALGPLMNGIAFEETMRERLKQAGVRRETNSHITAIHGDRRTTVECSDGRWSCKGVIFAPNGTEPGLEGSSALHGFGVSYSAAADAPFFASRRVAVYGDPPRLTEHAWTAARHASEVVVLSKTVKHQDDVELRDDLRSSSAVTFAEGVELKALRADDSGMLSSIEIDVSGVRQSLNVAALFVAQHVIPVTDVIRSGGQTHGIAFAGLTAGIKYWEHAALVDDGARAARAFLNQGGR